jgi:adenosylhomocysteine nucleosidase
MARFLAFLALLFAPGLACAATPVDPVPRTAIISAFRPEWLALKASLKGERDSEFAGKRFLAGTIGDQPVVLLLSGESMTNAAMAAQLVIDHFKVTRMLFSGIAGGIDPGLTIGDVVVPDRWAEYLEGVFARAQGQDFVLPDEEIHERIPAVRALGHFGMIYPRAVQIGHGDQVEQRLWFPVDPGLLALARKTVANVPLTHCIRANCLRTTPRVVVGGAGISGSVFMDNAEFRAYAFKAYHAQVLDMETASVAQVAYSNGVPFLGFRSLSDLAGGGGVQNEEGTFFELASANAARVVETFLAALPPATPGRPRSH